MPIFPKPYEGEHFVQGEGARVRTIERNGKKIAVRVPRFSAVTMKRYFFTFKIANILFPGYFLKPVSARNVSEMHEGFLATEWIETDKTYHNYMKHFYKDLLDRPRRLEDPYGCGCDICTAHVPRVLQLLKGRDSIIGKLSEAGIKVNHYPINIGFKDGSPVFFEILHMNPAKILKYVEGRPFERTVKRLIGRLLEQKEQHESVDLSDLFDKM